MEHVNLWCYLDGTVTVVNDFDLDSLAVAIDHDAVFLRNYCAWETPTMVQRGI